MAIIGRQVIKNQYCFSQNSINGKDSFLDIEKQLEKFNFEAVSLYILGTFYLI